MPFFEKVRELIQNRDCFGGRLAEMRIDYEKEPPMFQVTDTHYAATWLLDERAPKVKAPIGEQRYGK